MATGYIKNRKLSKFKSNRHSGRKLGTDNDEREKRASKTMKDQTEKKESVSQSTTSQNSALSGQPNQLSDTVH